MSSRAEGGLRPQLKTSDQTTKKTEKECNTRPPTTSVIVSASFSSTLGPTRRRSARSFGSSGFSVLGGQSPQEASKYAKAGGVRQRKEAVQGRGRYHVPAAAPASQPRRVHWRRSPEAVQGPNPLADGPSADSDGRESDGGLRLLASGRLRGCPVSSYSGHV